ncbi:glycoside hydrolase family 5 protein [Asticcacaulis solisilvae]|uniref:glycoside hydrolase family 5 protein n=1 Tax=Asticcacaulis solisilvae TaxID=1217274 RepID=UPI003FD8ECA7
MFDTDTIVGRHGGLGTAGGRIVDRHGQPFVLSGMSLFWSQWMPQFYCAGTVRWLREDWGCNAVRAALAVNFGGYRQDPEAEWRKVTAVVDAAIAEGIYVLVDWHVHEMEIISAATFFDRLSRAYGDVPNLIYEIWNEPYPRYGWSAHIKPYCAEIIPIIRANAPRSLIVAGTPTYSQRPDLAAGDPLGFDNVAYAVHFYAASHRGAFRDYCTAALDRRLPLLASEYGTCESNGDGRFDPVETEAWWRFLRRHHIGHFNWSVADKLETAAALLPGASPDGHWPAQTLTPSGRLVRAYLRSLAGQGALDIADSRAQVGGQ